MKPLYTFIAGIVAGLLIMYLVQPEPDRTDIDRLKARYNALNDSLQSDIAKYNRAMELVEQSKQTHIPDTVYDEINTRHEIYIDSIIRLNPDGTVRELSRWLTEADTLRRRHADTD